MAWLPISSSGLFACLTNLAAAATQAEDGWGMSTGSGGRSGDVATPPYVCLMCRVIKALVILPMKPLNSMPISSFFTVPYGYRMSMGISTNTGPGTCRIDVNGNT